MRILMVYEIENMEFENPYVLVLSNSLSAIGADTTVSTEEFWHPEKEYDVIFFQWPEAIFNFSHIGRTEVDRIAAQIAFWKSKGAIIAYTRHNNRAHTDRSDSMAELYGLVETSCDLIIHLGKTSMQSCASKLSNAFHCVVPHHTMTLINRDVPQSKARDRLVINKNKKVVLCFGAFRNDAERWAILKAFRLLEIPNKLLLAPGFFPRKLFRKNIFLMIENFLSRMKFLPYVNILGHPRVTNSELPYYFAASDVVLIQRLDILNSGNLPMGFYFGKPVVGPQSGNVGEILQETGNGTFDPSRWETIAQALHRVLSQKNDRIGRKNQQIADLYWNPMVVARQLLNMFEKVKQFRSARRCRNDFHNHPEL